MAPNSLIAKQSPSAPFESRSPVLPRPMAICLGGRPRACYPLDGADRTHPTSL